MKSHAIQNNSNNVTSGTGFAENVKKTTKKILNRLSLCLLRKVLYKIYFPPSSIKTSVVADSQVLLW